MQSFIPPGFNLPLAWTADLIHPFMLKSMHNIDEIVVSLEDRKMLRSLRDRRLLFFTNHPSTAEPPIAWAIGNMMGARFRYMASRQVFDWGYGIVGQAIASLGAYSVIAGIADRESLKMSRTILARPGGKLAVFPEGEPTSGENDSLMPFQPGAAQLGFWALDDARKQDPAADITVLEGFIKYVIQASRGEVMLELEKAIDELERKMGVNPGNRNLLRRYLHFGKVLLEQAEDEYRIPVASRGDFDYRIGRVRHAILDGVADKLAVKNYDRRADAIVKLRQVWAVVEMLMIDLDDPNLPRLSKADLDWAHRECVKAFDMIVIKRDYLLSNPTAERFFEWLARFDSYVLGKKPRALGGQPTPLPRKAYVSFTKPFGLSEYYDGEKRRRKQSVEKVTKRLHQELDQLRREAAVLTRPLVEPENLGDEA